MKQCMKFNLWGNTVAVYYQEETDSYVIYLIVSRRKLFLDEVDGLNEAADFCINYCYENA